MFRNSKLGNFKVRKIIWCFCVNVNATQTAILLSLNRNTINNWFNVFRRTVIPPFLTLIKSRVFFQAAKPNF